MGCYRTLGDIEPDSAILAVADIDFWMSVLTLCAKYNYKLEEHKKCWLIPEICRRERPRLTAAIFHQLTAEKFLGGMAPETAILLLKLEVEIVGDFHMGTQALSSLHERCVDSLSDAWDTLNDRDGLFHIWCQRPMVLAELCSASLSKAKREMEQQKKIGLAPIIVSGAGTACVCKWRLSPC